MTTVPVFIVIQESAGQTACFLFLFSCPSPPVQIILTFLLAWSPILVCFAVDTPNPRTAESHHPPQSQWIFHKGKAPGTKLVGCVLWEKSPFWEWEISKWQLHFAKIHVYWWSHFHVSRNSKSRPEIQCVFRWFVYSFLKVTRVLFSYPRSKSWSCNLQSLLQRPKLLFVYHSKQWPSLLLCVSFSLWQIWFLAKRPSWNCHCFPLRNTPHRGTILVRKFPALGHWIQRESRIHI